MVGHGRALETLIRSFEGGRAHHAYLLSGPEGIGKQTVARLVGQSLLCEQHRIGRPCGVCGECHRVLAGSHPDWIELAAEGQFIKIGSVRQLTHTLSYRSFEGGERVVLVDGAERLTEEAANALLKTLEEPPLGTTFFLVTSNQAQLLPTIVSRCQHLSFSALPPEQVEIVLERAGITSSRALARYSGGSPGRAAALAGDPAFARRGELFEAFQALQRPDGPGVLAFGEWSEPLSDDGEGSRLARQRRQTRQVVEMLKILLRDVMLLMAEGSPERLVNVDRRTELAQTARRLTWDSLSAILSALREAEAAVDGNVTPRLVLENLASRVASAAESQGT